MKSFLFVLALLPSLSALASPVDCYRDSRIADLNTLQSTRLCGGGDDAAPVDCYRDPRIAHFTKEESIRLCAGARHSYNPVDCLYDARIAQLGKTESIALCAAR